jgi:hypothetical protein
LYFYDLITFLVKCKACRRQGPAKATKDEHDADYLYRGGAHGGEGWCSSRRASHQRRNASFNGTILNFYFSLLRTHNTSTNSFINITSFLTAHLKTIRRLSLHFVQ